MAFGERPYWDWSNFEVKHKTRPINFSIHGMIHVPQRLKEKTFREAADFIVKKGTSQIERKCFKGVNFQESQSAEELNFGLHRYKCP